MKNIKDDELINLYKKIDFIFKRIESIREHLDIIFVFGRAPFNITSNQKKSSWNERIKKVFCSYKTEQNSIRTNFMNFVNRDNNTQFRFVTIETLYDDLSQHAPLKGVKSKKIKLAELELNAIRNAYSVLIFPESPGSFAELGYFAAKEETRDRIVVSTHVDFVNDKSYIKSLIEVVHEDRDIDPIILKENNDIGNFKSYLERLNDRYSDYDLEVYTSEDIEKHYMFPVAIIYETIKYFSKLEFSEFKALIRYIFKDLGISTDNFDSYLPAMISLLYVSDLIDRKMSDGKKLLIVKDDSFRCLKSKVDFSEAEYKKISSVVVEINTKKEMYEV